MILLQAVTAFMALEQMALEEYEYDLALAVVLTRKAISEHVAFFGGEERKLIEAYAKRDEGGNICFTERGGFLFADESKVAEYNEKRRRLCEIPVMEGYAPIKAKPPAMLKPAHLEALGGLIEFVRDGEA